MKSRAALLAVLALVSAWLPVSLAGQTKTPSFEVASVKPNKSGATGVRIQIQPGGRFLAVNATVRQLVREAYSLQNFQMSGGPAWIASDTFDIEARGPGSDAEVLVMLQGLLADRFKLKIRQESREMPIFALMKARSDGRLGPKMKPAEKECEKDCGINLAPGHLSATSVTMALLARVLPVQGRLVIDKTDLEGRFDFDLAWATEETAQDAQKRDSAGTPASAGTASIFTALQEQLGLKIESQRGPVPVLVIESAEHPTPD